MPRTPEQNAAHFERKTVSEPAARGAVTIYHDHTAPKSRGCPDTEGRRRLCAFPRDVSQLHRLPHAGGYQVSRYHGPGIGIDAILDTARVFGFTVEELAGSIRYSLDAAPSARDGRALREFIDKYATARQRQLLAPSFTKLVLRLGGQWDGSELVNAEQARREARAQGRP